MYLTLQIVSAPNLEQLPDRSCTFGIEGGKIGRSANNEWCIPFDYLHGLHATVRFYNGLFFIEKRGQHRVAVNSPDSDMKTDGTYPIRDGDRLYLDELEVSVRVGPDRPAAVAKASAPAPSSSNPMGMFGDRTAPERTGGLLDSDPPGDSDIDRFLNFGAPQSAPSLTRHEAANHQSILHDSVYLAQETTSPSRLASTSLQSQEKLDEDWYKTQLKMPEAPAVVSPPRPPPAPPIESRYPETRATPPPAPIETRTSAPAPRPGDEFTALLQSLGLTPRDLAPGEAELLGRALRTALTGIVSALQVRAEMRSRYRVADNRRSEENLLESSANADDALHRFFRHRTAGAAVPAFDTAIGDALQDIKLHEFALLDALRTAFDKLVEHFNPEAIQEQMDNSSIRASRSMLGGKSRHWEAYLELYAGIAADRESFFRKVCAPEFAGAYQQALEKYQTAARAKRRT
jgi:type VI secretion system protein ImpI